MKNFFKSKRTLGTLFLVIAIVLTVVFFIGVYDYGKDYTEEYQIYSDIKDFISLEDIRSKLQELKIEYTISSNSITLERYDNISFEKRDASWQIKENTIMSGFELLDNEDLNEVTITGKTTDDGNFKEVIRYKNGKHHLSKIDNIYYADYFWELVLPLPIIILFSLGILFFISASSKNTSD